MQGVRIFELLTNSSYVALEMKLNFESRVTPRSLMESTCKKKQILPKHQMHQTLGSTKGGTMGRKLAKYVFFVISDTILRKKLF
jgi:hypothetical protein